MEILKKGSDNVFEAGVRGCCWPPATEGFRYTEPEE